MKCHSCNVEPQIIRGEEIEQEGKKYWKQTYTCNNPSCTNYQTEIGYRLVNLSNEEDIQEFVTVS